MKLDRNYQRLKYKEILSRGFLEGEYLKKKKSISQLKKELGIDWNTIKYYLLLYKMPLRSHKEQAFISSPGGKYKYSNLLKEQFLIEEYSIKKKGIIALSRELKLDSGTIKRYLKKYGIEIRKCHNQREINHPSKEFLINQESLSFIDGLLLGDACITQRKSGIPPRSFTQACKYSEYLEYIYRRLFEMGISCSPILTRWIKDDRCKNDGYNQSFLQTRRYRTFEIFRERWYKNRIKIIPKDLKITKDLLLQTYLCDGNFYREIRLCLDDFDISSINLLKRLIEKEVRMFPRVIKSSGNYELAIKKSDTPKFFDYIGNCPVKCYKYKWSDNESEKMKERKRLKARLLYHRQKKDGKESDIRHTFS